MMYVFSCLDPETALSAAKSASAEPLKCIAVNAIEHRSVAQLVQERRDFDAVDLVAQNVEIQALGLQDHEMLVNRNVGFDGRQPVVLHAAHVPGPAARSGRLAGSTIPRTRGRGSREFRPAGPRRAWSESRPMDPIGWRPGTATRKPAKRPIRPARRSSRAARPFAKGTAPASSAASASDSANAHLGNRSSANSLSPRPSRQLPTMVKTDSGRWKK